ncbi:hypothetical protein SARC_07835 [Sphaeroforma arctica JP610]|uniref:Uncharacterized protein n=1 Tax=Sphaeroforma arctica JP610 TaxID=667725 RepID=A0A0L0FSV7_9EUKA|nr:hypothetical protein SARC_07835 [Sphaeroforma arctica JP610]KNC79779.1 hypothetical protein SARC_07835 [Sphaeroforma arctica JP610]|eukprot:XP_014153681.1 hypothetical protein SARC_07835 [Sphaeroforma arctica JP610]
MNNVTKDFAAATGGCNSTLGDGSSYNSMFENVNSTNDFGCSNDFIQAWSLLGKTGTRYDTFKVFRLLKNHSDPIELPWSRAALWAGQNVNPMNTFDGVSHNGLAKHFPEFIVRNLSLDETNLAGLEYFSLIDMFATNTTTNYPSPTSSLPPTYPYRQRRRSRQILHRNATEAAFILRIRFMNTNAAGREPKMIAVD